MEQRLSGDGWNTMRYVQFLSGGGELRDRIVVHRTIDQASAPLTTRYVLRVSAWSIPQHQNSVKGCYNSANVDTLSRKIRVSRTERRLLTVDVDRRGYGRRYTSLPVDEIRPDGFSIRFEGAYIRPEHIDVRLDDIVRWREGGRLFQGRVIDVRREAQALHVTLTDVAPLPPDAFFP